MSNEYLVWSNKHRAWWGPGQRGYTLDVGAAGRYPYGAALECVGRSARAGQVDLSSTIVVAPEAWGEHAQIQARRAAPTQGVPLVVDAAGSRYIAFRCVYCGAALLWTALLNMDVPMTVDDLSHQARLHAPRCRDDVTTRSWGVVNVHSVR